MSAPPAGRVVVQGLVFDWICTDGEMRVSNAQYGGRTEPLGHALPELAARLIAFTLIDARRATPRPA